MIAWIEARIWQVAAVFGGLAAIIAVTAWIMTSLDLRRTRHLLENADQVIAQHRDDLATCRRGIRDLESELADQNAAILSLGRESADRIAAAERSMRSALQGQASLKVEIEKLVAAGKGSGATCDRLVEVDAAVLEVFR